MTMTATSKTPKLNTSIPFKFEFTFFFCRFCYTTRCRGNGGLNRMTQAKIVPLVVDFPTPVLFLLFPATFAGGRSKAQGPPPSRRIKKNVNYSLPPKTYLFITYSSSMLTTLALLF